MAPLKAVFARLFATRTVQPFALWLLQVLVRMLGFEHSRDLAQSGEQYFIRKWLGESRGIVIDVGANSGRYSREVLVNTSCDVVAFDPLVSEIPKIAKLRDDFPSRLRIEPLGLGRERGKATLYRDKNRTALASLVPEVLDIEYVDEQSTEALMIHLESLDSWWESNFGWGREHEIELIKIDVEGFELEVLAGGTKFLDTYRPKFIQVESNIHNLYTGSSIFQLSRLLPGYKLYQILPYRNGLAKRSPSKPESNLYFFSNFLFIRGDLAGSVVKIGN